MPDHIIKSGDMIQITLFPPALVPSVVLPVPLQGTSTNALVNNMPVCLEGDELPAALRTPQPYTAPPFVTPGMGMLKLTLGPSNKTITTQNGSAILLKGTPFLAEFQVTVPAMQPTPVGPIPDPIISKPGNAQFITTNVTVAAS